MSSTRGPIAYMAKHHVSSNMLMFVMVIGGLLMAPRIKQEVFPVFDIDMLTVTVAYPGATPSEVEEAILLPVENAISGVQNIKQVTSTASEGVGIVTVEVLEGADPDQVVQDVKSEVDRITTLPGEAERPIVAKVAFVREVLTLVIYGDVSERSLLEQAERVRDDLLSLPDITQVVVSGYRPYEISVEVPEAQLREYNLTLPAIAQKISNASLDLAGGSIKTKGGEILIRTKERRLYGSQFDSVAILSYPTGEEVMLGDIAEVIDGFEQIDREAIFDGKPAILVNVYSVGDQKPKEVANAAKGYIEEQNKKYPDSLNIAIWRDSSEILQSRLNLLVRNGMIGLVLVMITLSLFLELRLAFWVASGIAISFLGSLLIIPLFDVTINMMSLFAFLLVLGIVVDDAIVVGENIYVHRKDNSLLGAAIHGAQEVRTAVVFSALTTIAAFIPLLFVGGFFSRIMGVVPIILIVILALSLTESLFVLPSHLSNPILNRKGKFWDKIEAQRSKFDRFVNWMTNKLYAKSLAWAIRNRYTTVAISVSMLLLTAGLIFGGYVKFTMMAAVDADSITISVKMAPGTPYEDTERVARYIESIGDQLVAEVDAADKMEESNLIHKYTLIGQTTSGRSTSSAPNLAQIRYAFLAADQRTVNVGQLNQKWRAAVGELPGIETINFRADMMRSGADIELELSHSDFNQLLAAVEDLKRILRQYDGTYEVADSYTLGKQEINVRLKEEARNLGITEANIASQVRGAFYGSEALRVQRGRNEVKVLVRYPEEDRRSLETLDQLRIRTTDGKEIPLKQAATLEIGRGYSVINRTNSKRVVTVTASVDDEVTNATQIMQQLYAGPLEELVAKYPGLNYQQEGMSKDQQESVAAFKTAFIFALLLIFGLLAIPFDSFSQPLVVMSAIPFGLVGAVAGHIIFGYNLTMMSLMGMMALMGVVVNSSLVMIDFINTNVRAGMKFKEAILDAGPRRFRPIILTAITTFLGLVPIISETSIQAKFLVPMALALGFGVLFATFITLLLVPSLLMILEDAKRKLNIRALDDEERVGELTGVIDR